MLTSSSGKPPDNSPLNTPSSTPRLQMKPWKHEAALLSSSGRSPSRSWLQSHSPAGSMTLFLPCCYCDIKNFKGTLTESFLCLHHICLLVASGYSALLRLPGFHLRCGKSARSQFWGHGPLRKVFPDPAAGGQPGGGGAQQWRGGRQGLEGGASRPGVTANGSLRLRSAGLDGIQSMKPNTDVTPVSSSLKAKSEDKCRSYWSNSACANIFKSKSVLIWQVWQVFSKSIQMSRLPFESMKPKKETADCDSDCWFFSSTAVWERPKEVRSEGTEDAFGQSRPVWQNQGRRAAGGYSLHNRYPTEYAERLQKTWWPFRYGRISENNTRTPRMPRTLF